MFFDMLEIPVVAETQYASQYPLSSSLIAALSINARVERAEMLPRGVR